MHSCTNTWLPGWASWNVRLDFPDDVSLRARIELANLVNPAAGHLFVHAMRLPSPQAGHPYIKSEILEHGQLDQ